MSWHEDFQFTKVMKARMDAQCQEIEETSRKIENHMKLIFNTLNIRSQQLAQGDSEIPNREENEQVFGVDEQIAQKLSPIAQENSYVILESHCQVTLIMLGKKGKNNAKLLLLEVTNKFWRR
ncbi:hypothetical protein V6N11_012003 [Hibiscus sabdariffa]|uniref:Uncharacterized protein n=2 Tax=Hibiscus sabdariffa TaxID=183260 RepID=A0ABR2DDC1_9ROSI